MTRIALITGITGQDGSYLAEYLLGLGYQVHGVVRRSSTFSTERIDHLYREPQAESRLRLHYGDLTDGQSLTNLVLKIRPDEIYNLGAQSHVRVSFDQPVYTLQAVGCGALNILEAARLLNESHPVRVYQASSSEMYGDVLQTPQTERTPFNPQSPYACAKVYAFHQTINYRRSYDLFASTGFYSIMNRSAGEKHSLLGKSLVQPGVSKQVYRKNFTWVISMPNGIGATQKTMSRECT